MLHACPPSILDQKWRNKNKNHMYGSNIQSTFRCEPYDTQGNLNFHKFVNYMNICYQTWWQWDNNLDLATLSNKGWILDTYKGPKRVQYDDDDDDKVSLLDLLLEHILLLLLVILLQASKCSKRKRNTKRG